MPARPSREPCPLDPGRARPAYATRRGSPCTRCATDGGVAEGARDRSPPGARWTRLRGAAETRGIPLWTILTTVAVVAAIYVGGKLLYRLRDVLLLLAVSGFVALILNQLVVALQRRIAPCRGVAVAIVTASALLVVAGLVVGCGYPLATGLTHLASRLPGYVASAERGQGWTGHLLRHYHVQAWAKRNAPELMSAAK